VITRIITIISISFTVKYRQLHVMLYILNVTSSKLTYVKQIKSDMFHFPCIN